MVQAVTYRNHTGQRCRTVSAMSDPRDPDDGGELEVLFEKMSKSMQRR